MNDNVRESTTMYDNVRQILEAFEMAKSTHEPNSHHLESFLVQALATDLLERAYKGISSEAADYKATDAH